MCESVSAPPLLIALDFDQTFTADEDLWRHFIESAQSRGHKVIVVTARRGKFLDERSSVTDRLPDGVPVYFSYDVPKGQYMRQHGIDPDIWIDDTPEGI